MSADLMNEILELQRRVDVLEDVAARVEKLEEWANEKCDPRGTALAKRAEHAARKAERDRRLRAVYGQLEGDDKSIIDDILDRIAKARSRSDMSSIAISLNKAGHDFRGRCWTTKDLDKLAKGHGIRRPIWSAQIA